MSYSKRKSLTRGKESVLNKIQMNLTSFGEVETSLKVDQINRFLDSNLADKKLGNKVSMD